MLPYGGVKMYTAGRTGLIRALTTAFLSRRDLRHRRHRRLQKSSVGALQ